MNIVNKLTLRHLKLNKKRTLVTIIGVIISVTMITAVATFAESFLGTMRNYQIESGGNWHVLYQQVPADKLDIIYNDKDTKHAILSRDEGYAKLESPQSKSQPYLFVKDYSEQGFSNFPVELLEGRFPQNSSEIVLQKSLIESGSLSCQIGDTLTLEVGSRTATVEDHSTGEMQTLENLDQRTVVQEGETLQHTSGKTYTVVGFIQKPGFENDWAPGITAIAGLDPNSLQPGETVDVSVELKTLSRDLYKHAQQIAGELGMPEVRDVETGELLGYRTLDFNSSLLQYSGITNSDSFQMVFYRICAIVIVVIMIGSISLIYNAFSISISERSRHLGMLASVGATKAQKRKSVFFEGATIGLIAIPLGILFGIGGMWLTFQCVNPLLRSSANNMELSLTISWLSILIAVVFSALTIFISTWIPARRASKISPIDAIRQTKDVKLKGKNVKTSRLTRKVFGFEAELALKNLKRNKRRYKATIFSLTISILLFLSVSSFMQMLVQANRMSAGELGYNFSVDAGTSYSEEKEFFDKAANLPDAGEHLTYETMNTNTVLGESQVSDLRKKGNPPLDEGYYYSVQLVEIDDQAFDAYCKLANIDPAALRGSTVPSGILFNKATFQDKKTGKFVEGKSTNLTAGGSIGIYHNSDGKFASPLFEMQVAAVTEQKLELVGNLNGRNDVLTLILPRGTLDSVREKLPEDDRFSYTNIVYQSPNPDGLEKDLETLGEGYSVRYSYMNIDSQARKMDQMTMVMLIFAYGFVILISAIGVANIFNTISTSIQLRKREFAMLKSVGMTPKGFNRMLNYESIFYGIKALLYGIPLSFVAMFLMYYALGEGFTFGFAVPWVPLVIAVVAVFLIVGSTMLYAGHKVKRENIIDALKEENI